MLPYQDPYQYWILSLSLEKMSWCDDNEKVRGHSAKWPTNCGLISSRCQLHVQTCGKIYDAHGGKSKSFGSRTIWQPKAPSCHRPCSEQSVNIWPHATTEKAWGRVLQQCKILLWPYWSHSCITGNAEDGGSKSGHWLFIHYATIRYSWSENRIWGLRRLVWWWILGDSNTQYLSGQWCGPSNMGSGKHPTS